MDDFADVNVKIQDKGILKLSKPYFYLLVFDPSDKLKEMYPCFINEKEKQFSGSIGTSYVYSHKWAQWVSPTIVLAGNQYSCADKEAFYFYPNNCISRLDLMDGNIINTPIRYTFKITEPGTWKIYVFLFDEEYKSRPNTNLLNEYDKGPVSFQNAVAYGYSEISVKSEIGLIESSGIDLKNLLPVLINALIAGIGYYGIGRKEIYPKLKDIYYNHIKKLKSEILGLLGLLALITIYFLIMLKFVFT